MKHDCRFNSVVQLRWHFLLRDHLYFNGYVVTQRKYKTMSYGQGICLIMCLFPMFIGFRSHRCRHHGMPCKILPMRMSKMLKTIVRFFSFDLEDENDESIESQTLYILPPFPGSPGPPSKIAYTPQSTSSQNNHS